MYSLHKGWKMQCLWKHLGPKTWTQRNTNDSFWGDLSLWLMKTLIIWNLSPSDFLNVSKTKQCSERTTILERRGSHCKSGESTETRIEKWSPGMLLKVYEC
jgi:hypothetical protein